jgi:hypothetical protein
MGLCRITSSQHALREKIMHKTNSSKFGHGTFEDHGTLADSELDAVTGGIFREPTYHPAKVTVPDIKLSISLGIR